jgi:Do/DeqQ family serine protease
MFRTRNTGARQRLVKGGLGATVAAATLAAVLGVWYAREPRVEAAAQAPPAAAAERPTVTGRTVAGFQESYADLVARVSPAVVTIRATRTVKQAQLPFDDDMLRRFFGGAGPGHAIPHREGGLGSGVVVTADGYVLTNHHVVDGADRIRVDFADGRSYEARVIGRDQPTDLAVLKVPATGLTTIPLGDSDAARVGDVVLAIGNPLGVGQTVTMGIVSAKGRATGGGGDTFEDFIQTDAPINQGNSGGALVNLRGELIGINSQILSPVGFNIGIGFAIPVNMAQNVMHQLMNGGAVHRGMLGVTVQAVNGEMASSLGLPGARGAIVSDVQEGSPAASAGIQPGDVILALNGRPVDSSNDLRNHVAPLGPGASATLTLWRDGHERKVTATLTELPGDKAAANREATPAEGGRYGLAVEPLTPQRASELGAKTSRGVVVTDVDPDGPAAEAGLQSGDVIEQVNGRAIASGPELRSALESGKGDKPALVLIERQGRRLFVTLDHPAA